MADLKAKLENLGLLHDSIVQQVIWKPEKKTIEFVVEDFYSNFHGLPEYPGSKGGSIILNEVQHVELDIDYSEEYLAIYEFEIADGVRPDTYRIVVRFRPSGRVQVVCGHVEFPEIEIPVSKR